MSGFESEDQQRAFFAKADRVRDHLGRELSGAGKERKAEIRRESRKDFGKQIYGVASKRLAKSMKHPEHFARDLEKKREHRIREDENYNKAVY